MNVIGVTEACSRLVEAIVRGDMGYILIMSDGERCVMKTNVKPEHLAATLQDSLDSVAQLKPDEEEGARN